jgi:hypothetical protein
LVCFIYGEAARRRDALAMGQLILGWLHYIGMFPCVHFVYKTHDRHTGETVTGNGEGDAFDKMFRREVRCLEACRGHPCLVELHVAHHVAAGTFLVMEYTRQSLPEVLRADQHDERSRKA